jgi:hypothetical protein
LFGIFFLRYDKKNQTTMNRREARRAFLSAYLLPELFQIVDQYASFGLEDLDRLLSCGLSWRYIVRRTATFYVAKGFMKNNDHLIIHFMNGLIREEFCISLADLRNGTLEQNSARVETDPKFAPLWEHLEGL